MIRYIDRWLYNHRFFVNNKLCQNLSWKYNKNLYISYVIPSGFSSIFLTSLRVSPWAKKISSLRDSFDLSIEYYQYCSGFTPWAERCHLFGILPYSTFLTEGFTLSYLIFRPSGTRALKGRNWFSWGQRPQLI